MSDYNNSPFVALNGIFQKIKSIYVKMIRRLIQNKTIRFLHHDCRKFETRSLAGRKNIRVFLYLYIPCPPSPTDPLHLAKQNKPFE
jgi:hypothetical protein